MSYIRYLVGFSRIFVGVLFVLSGLIKLNDPVGFSFKLQEYFSPYVLNISFLEPYALSIAIFIVVFEVILGVFLLLGFRVKFTNWCLLIMILFFTFLTFYSAYFNKVTDCGCFGDAIKLTPWESFIKDIVLLFFILILFFYAKYITPWFTYKIRNIFFVISLLSCFVLVYYVLHHLPLIDFRPYKINTNIIAGMEESPEGAPKPVFDYHWKFLVNGKEKTIITRGSYPEIEGKYLSIKTVEIEEGYKPPIQNFTIEKNGEDMAQTVLQEPHLIIIVSYDVNLSNWTAFEKLKIWSDDALKKGYKVIGMSASSSVDTEVLREKFSLNFDFYFTDETTLKTIIRSNPGILVLEKGTIVQKSHFNDIEDIKINTLNH